MKSVTFALKDDRLDMQGRPSLQNLLKNTTPESQLPPIRLTKSRSETVLAMEQAKANLVEEDKAKFDTTKFGSFQFD
jgi:hypothetical protein